MRLAVQAPADKVAASAVRLVRVPSTGSSAALLVPGPFFDGLGRGDESDPLVMCHGIE